MSNSMRALGTCNMATSGLIKLVCATMIVTVMMVRMIVAVVVVAVAEAERGENPFLSSAFECRA